MCMTDRKREFRVAEMVLLCLGCSKKETGGQTDKRKTIFGGERGKKRYAVQTKNLGEYDTQGSRVITDLSTN